MSDDKYAILGDIHGNLEALETVLADAKERGASSYVCVGDIVGYNANPSECLAKIQELNCVCVRGNHDHYCSHDECLDDFHPLAADVMEWTRNQLSKDQVQYLRNLKLHRTVSAFTIVHSTLDMPAKWGYIFDELDADANFNYQHTSVCFYGHTHVPVVFERQSRTTALAPGRMRVVVGRKYLINTGSVGQPRDGDWRAAYLLYTPKTGDVEFRRLEYDIKAAQKKIRDVGLPERLARRLEIGK